MNHPTKEELVSFLYGEVSPRQKTGMNLHLQSCPECRAVLSEWQQVKGDLSAWKVAALPQRPVAAAKVLKWAAAAMFVIAIAFGIGRATGPGLEVEALRAELKTELRSEFEQQLKASRETDRKQFIAMLRDIEEQRLADYTDLRKDLETVAVVADEKLTTTAQALNRLNLIAQSESSFPSTE